MVRDEKLLSFYKKEKNMIFTNHSIVRCQQRGVSKDVVEFICKHGKKVNTHGDHKYFINKKALNNLMIKRSIAHNILLPTPLEHFRSGVLHPTGVK